MVSAYNGIFVKTDILGLCDDGFGNLVRITGSIYSRALDFTIHNREYYDVEVKKPEMSYV